MDCMGCKGEIQIMTFKYLTVILLIMVAFTGCSFINKDTEKNEDYQSPKEYATEQSEYIMECIVNKDKEGLKSVFSKHIAETHNLDKEIDEFFEFIDGEIISYDEPEGYEGGYRMRYGEYTEKVLTGEINNILTKNGANYSVGMRMYSIYKENRDHEGVSIINIIKEGDTLKQCAIGSSY